MTIPTADLRWLILRDSLDECETTTDGLLSLRLLEQAAAMVRQLTGEVVTYARQNGSTWEDVGKALGVTKQAAWLRFAGSETVGKPPAWQR